MDYNWNQKNILIVEDEFDSYLLLKTILSSTRANILHAKDGQKAIDFSTQNEDVDVVLMDIQMPGKTGFEATKEIKSIKPNLPIIAQTAFAMYDESQLCMEAGCDDYISKPINRKLLLKLIAKHLD